MDHRVMNFIEKTTGTIPLFSSGINKMNGSEMYYHSSLFHNIVNVLIRNDKYPKEAVILELCNKIEEQQKKDCRFIYDATSTLYST